MVCNLREGARGVDGLALTVEVGVAVAVGVVVATIGIAETGITVIRVSSTTAVTLVLNTDVVVVV
jgi:L-lactate utilization protein LutC